MNGDGADVYEDQYDTNGSYLGREPVTKDGEQVRHYSPPEGFTEVPTRDPGADGVTASHVRANERGQIHRNVKGEAVGIRPGTVLVEYPDGTHELLTSGFAQRQFEKAHEFTGEGE